MSRRVKEYIDVKDHKSLDEVIAQLTQLREQLPEGCEAELKLRGDDVFGHRLTVTYFREQTEEEAECERRYAEAQLQAKEKQLEQLQQELGKVCYEAPGKRGKLRIVA